MIVTELRLRPSPDVVHQRLEGEIVLVNLKTNRIFALNRTGARLWELLEVGCDRSEISRQMQAEFDVDAAQLEQEIEALLSSLLDEELVVSTDE
jgi:hypothetical protein